jgi:hypothetical protein
MLQVDNMHHAESVPNLPEVFLYDDHPDLMNGNYSVNPLKKMNYSSTLFVILIFVCDMWRKYLIIFKGNN